MSDQPRHDDVPEHRRVTSFVRPDRRLVVRCDGAWTAAAADDACAKALEARAPALVHLDESDIGSLTLLVGRGFAVSRRESRVVIDVESALRSLCSRPVPPGIVVLSAVDVDEEALRRLDDELREDVPGTTGWRSSPDEFHVDTFCDPGFDPTTYLVAVKEAGNELLGLVRIWMNASGPRLGLLGVRRHVRRRGLGAALLLHALAAARGAGASRILTEYDDTNQASRQLATRLEAAPLGRTIELVYVPDGRRAWNHPPHEERSHVVA